MKKSLWIFTFWAGLIGSANATFIPVEVGFKGGLNMSTQVGTYASGISGDETFNFEGGFFADFDFNNLISIQPECNFTVKGTQLNDNDVQINGAYTSSVQETESFEYLEIPLLLRFRTPLDVDVQSFLLLGPAFSFRLSADYNQSVAAFGPNAAYSNTGSIPGASAYDWGLIMGGGIEAGNFLWDIRYEHGFSSALNSNASQYDQLTLENNGKNLQNSVVTLEMGYRIQ